MSTVSPVVDTEGGHLRRILGLPSLVLFGVVYMVPLTVFTTYGVVTEITGGRLPTAYLVTLVAMVFTAVSYGSMVEAYPVSGSAYTYTQKSFGGSAGFVTGWSLLLDYLFLPMINYLVIGIFMNAQFPGVPAWVFVLVSIALVTVLNIVGIRAVDRMNVVIMAAQGIFVVVFVALTIAHIAGRSPDLSAPFTGDGSVVGLAALLSGSAVLCLSFLGFDAVSTLAEEAREPVRDIPRAILIVTIGCGLLFVLLSYLGHLVLPDHTFTDVDSAALDVMREAGGTFLATFFTAAYVAGATGSALTSQASVSRILFAMGRDGVLPRRVFGRLHPRFLTPHIAVLIVSAISLLALVVSLTTLAEMVSFGALVAFSAVNLSVVKHYVVDRHRTSLPDLLRFGLLPTIGLALTVWLWTSLNGRTLVIGLIWMTIGITYLAFLTRGFRRPPPELDIEEV